MSSVKWQPFCLGLNMLMTPLTMKQPVWWDHTYRISHTLQWRQNNRHGVSNHQPHDFIYSTVYSGTDERKRQSSASLAFVREIHRWPVNSPHKEPVKQKMFPLDDVIMNAYVFTCLFRTCNGIHVFWFTIPIGFVLTTLLWLPRRILIYPER